MNKKTTYLNVLFKKRTKIILQDYRNCLFYKVQKMLAPIFVPNLIFQSTGIKQNISTCSYIQNPEQK